VTQDQPNSDGQAPQRSGSFLEDQQSRRLFLKAAVISGAAVAAVGAAGVAAANASPQILRQLRGAPATVSGQGTATMCIEDSGFTPIDTFTVDKNQNAQPGTFFIWFTVQHLPAGTYSYSLTMSPPSGSPGDSTMPFELSDPGNNVYTFELAEGTASNCPTADPATLTKSGHAISDDFPYVLGSQKDFQVRVHLKYNNSAISLPQIFTFTGVLTNTSTLATYTGTASVTAIAK